MSRLTRRGWERAWRAAANVPRRRAVPNSARQPIVLEWVGLAGWPEHRDRVIAGPARRPRLPAAGVASQHRRAPFRRSRRPSGSALSVPPLRLPSDPPRVMHQAEPACKSIKRVRKECDPFESVYRGDGVSHPDPSKRRLCRLSGLSYCSGVTGEVWILCAGGSPRHCQGSSSSSKVPSEGSTRQAASRTL